MSDGEQAKTRDNSRAVRLEAELRANLRKRKQQARARAALREEGAATSGAPTGKEAGE